MEQIGEDAVVCGGALAGSTGSQKDLAFLFSVSITSAGILGIFGLGIQHFGRASISLRPR